VGEITEQMRDKPPEQMSLITVRPWVGWMFRGAVAVAAGVAALVFLSWVGTGLSKIGSPSDAIYSFSYAWHRGQADAACASEE